MTNGTGKGSDTMTVHRGLIFPEEGKIEEIRVKLSLGPICFSKIGPCIGLWIIRVNIKPLFGCEGIGGILRSYTLWKR